MITRVKAKVAGERAAARSGEDGKWSKYEKFLQRCAPEDPSDPRLQTEIIPFVVETHRRNREGRKEKYLRNGRGRE